MSTPERDVSTSRLTVRNLSFSYSAYPGIPETHLFEGLDLDLRPSELRVVLGIPESGKTTLSKICTGLVPRYEEGRLSGEVSLSTGPHRDTSPTTVHIPSVSSASLIKSIGTMFQDPDEQIFTTSCESEVAFALESLGLESEEIRRRVDEALEVTGLSSFSRRSPSSLSGGEKKRLLFAALFALSPPLWILDEPLDEVDNDFQRRFLTALTEGGYGVLIFASKILDVFDEFSVSYSLLHGGRLISEEEIGREELRKSARELGLAFEEDVHSSVDEKKDIETEEGEAASPSGPVLRAEELSFFYPPSGPHNDFALRLEVLELFPGEKVALVGPNGCGKTTLAKLLCGLLTPSEGSISLASPDLRSLTAGELPSRVGYIFQNPDYQIFLSTVKEELAYGLRELGLSEEEIEPRINEAVKRFHLPSLEVPPTVMSYGSRKRLQAAIYYLLDRSVYIVDEADSGLSLFDFADIVEALQGEERALLIITHNRRMGEKYADRTLFMEEGRIIEEGGIVR